MRVISMEALFNISDICFFNAGDRRVQEVFW